MRSDAIISKIIEDIQGETRMDAHNDLSSKEEVKNLEERIKNTIDKKFKEINDKLEKIAESQTSAGTNTVEPESAPNENTETLTENNGGNENE